MGLNFYSHLGLDVIGPVFNRFSISNKWSVICYEGF